MANGGTLSLNLLVTVLLLVPGIAALDLYFFTAKRRPTLSRTRLVAYGSGVSVFSLYLLFFTSSLYMPIFGGTPDPRNLLTVGEVAKLSLAQGALLYLSHVGISGIIGTIIGLRNRGDHADRREPWAFAFEEAPTENEPLDVTLNNGQTVRGTFNPDAFDGRQRELFLDNPSAIDEDGESVDLGRSIMIPENAISYIAFIEDPNTETARSIDLDEVEVPAEELDELISEIEGEISGSTYYAEETEENVDGKGS